MEKQNNTNEINLKQILVIIAIVIISSTGILISSIYLFSKPGLTSGLVFSAVILLLVILPFGLGIAYYFKVLKKQVKNDETETIIIESK